MEDTELENQGTVAEVETPAQVEGETTPAVEPTQPIEKEPAPAEPTGIDRIKSMKAAKEKADPAAPADKPAEEAAEPKLDADGNPVVEPPAAVFKAREKFKVMQHGSKEQKEIDVPEVLKGAMKDEASEKEIISLLEKAHGIEPLLAQRTEIRKELDHYRGEYGKIGRTIEDVRQTFQRGDIDAFLAKLAIPEEKMLQWALDKVTYSQLPAEQRFALDQSRENERKAYAAEQQVGAYQQQIQEQGRQAKSTLLEHGLTRPDVQTFAQAFDARVGKPGAFRSEIVALGELAFIQSEGKVDLTPDQAIEQALGKWKAFITPQAAPAPAPAAPPAAQAPGAPAAQTVIAPTAQGTVIPNVQGRAQSPLKSEVKSLSDLIKLRDAGRK